MQITIECSEEQLRDLNSAARRGGELQVHHIGDPAIKLVMNVSRLPTPKARALALRIFASALVAIIISYLTMRGSNNSIAAGTVIAIFLTCLIYLILPMLKSFVGLCWAVCLGFLAIVLRVKLAELIKNGVSGANAGDWVLFICLYLLLFMADRLLERRP